MALTKVTSGGISDIAAAVEGASDSNKFTDADHSKLNAIEASATADQTNAEIRAAVEAASDSNVFTDADHTKLNAIEASATADQTDAQIRAAVEAASDSNVFTDADHTKLNGVAASANNYVHPNHSGEVTSTADGAQVVADNIIDEANLKVSNAPTNGYFLSAQSGNTGGLTWAEVDTTIASAALPKAGGTMTGDLILSDNVKVEIGSASGGDLQIYHSSSDNNSYIDEAGSGSLYVRGNDLILGKYTGETYVDCNQDGSVDLYHNNSKKLETDSAGINVTGGIDLTGNIMGVTTIGKDGGDTISFDDNSKTQFHINGNEEMRLLADGTLHVDGSVVAFSTTISDERLKHDIKPIENALDKVGQLNGCTFTYNADGRESAGLIAQDVEKVLPSAVTEVNLPLKIDDGNEYKVLQYDQTIGLLVEAIKELTDKVNKLENK